MSSADEQEREGEHVEYEYVPDEYFNVDDIDKMVNQETYVISLENDFEELCRPCTTIIYCPLHEKCSANSWRGHQPWTLQTEPELKYRALMAYLKYHLCESGKHNLSEQDANELIGRIRGDGIKFKTSQDTFATREWYRNELQRHEKEKQERKSKGKKGKSKGGKGSVDESKGSKGSADGVEASELQAPGGFSLAATQSLLHQIMLLVDPRERTPEFANELAIQYAGGSGAVVPAAPGGKGKRTVSVAQLTAIRETVRRSADGLSSAMLVLVETTKRVRSEWQAVSRTREELDEIIRNSN